MQGRQRHHHRLHPLLPDQIDHVPQLGDKQGQGRFRLMVLLRMGCHLSPIVIAVVAPELDKRRVAGRLRPLQILLEQLQPFGHRASHAGAVEQPQPQLTGRFVRPIFAEQRVFRFILVIHDALHHTVSPYADGLNELHTAPQPSCRKSR